MMSAWQPVPVGEAALIDWGTASARTAPALLLSGFSAGSLALSSYSFPLPSPSLEFPLFFWKQQ